MVIPEGCAHVVAITSKQHDYICVHSMPTFFLLLLQTWVLTTIYFGWDFTGRHTLCWQPIRISQVKDIINAQVLETTE